MNSGKSAETLICSSCSSELQYGLSDASVKCNVCGFENNTGIGDGLIGVLPDRIVTSVIGTTDLIHSVRLYMASGQMTPDDLILEAKITSSEVYYVPAYSFSGNFEAKWTASFGYDRKESYTVYKTQYDSDLKRNIQVPVTETKTVTDWRPASGLASGSYIVNCYAGPDRSTGVRSIISRMAVSDGERLRSAPQLDLRYESSAKSGKAVYDEVGRSAVNAIIDGRVERHAQGDRQRDWNWNASIKTKTTSFALPVGFVGFSYKGKQYSYWLDGTGSGNFWGSTLPVDKKKIVSLVLGYLPAGAASVSLFSIDSSLNWAAGLAAFIFGALGGIRHWSIINFSKRRRENFRLQLAADEGGHEADQEGRLLDRSTDRFAKQPSAFERTDRDRILIPAACVAALAFAWFPVGSANFDSNTIGDMFPPLQTLWDPGRRDEGTPIDVVNKSNGAEPPTQQLVPSGQRGDTTGVNGSTNSDAVPFTGEELNADQLAGALVEELGPLGWGQCIAGWTGTTAYIARGEITDPTFISATEKVGSVLGAVRQRLLSQGIPDHILQKYIEAADQQIRYANDPSLAVMQYHKACMDRIAEVSIFETSDDIDSAACLENQFRQETGQIYLQAEQAAITDRNLDAALVKLNQLRGTSLNCYEESAVFRMLAYVKIEKGDRLGAIEDLLGALDRGYIPADEIPQTYYNIAQIYLQMEDNKSALKYLDKWQLVGGKPDQFQKWQLTVLYRHVNNFHESIRWGEEVLKADGLQTTREKLEFIAAVYALAESEPDTQEIPDLKKPSFDCAAASVVAEELICAHSRLAFLDRTMVNFYKLKIAASDTADDIRSEQRDWIAKTRQCETEICVFDAYLQRLEQLGN
jgi:tetratricopeptide (TPR) repeat protein